MNERAAVIFDLDGTLADTRHRQYFLERTPPEWDHFHLACHDDPPNQPVAEVLRDHFKQNRRVHIFTGREGSSEVHKRTVAWLTHHKIPFDGLWMRPEGDQRSALELKTEMLEQFHHRTALRVLCIYEDDPRVVEALRELRYPCMEVSIV